VSLCDSQSNLIVGEAQNPDQLLVEVDLPVPGHRAEPGLWIPGDFQLPHDPKEQRCPEPFRQFKPYRNAACRDRTNQGMFHGTVLFYEGSRCLPASARSRNTARLFRSAGSSMR